VGGSCDVEVDGRENPRFRLVVDHTFFGSR